MSGDLKRIYALTTTLPAKETYIYPCPKTNTTRTFTVPEDGKIIFYVGETSMTLNERYSKHRTFTKKLLNHLEGLDVNDVHDYAVYYFILTFCGDDGFDFQIELLQEGEGMTEAQWVSFAKEEGHPLMNTAAGSSSLVRKPVQDLSTLSPKARAQAEFRKQNPIFKKEDLVPLTPDEVYTELARRRAEREAEQARVKALKR